MPDYSEYIEIKEGKVTFRNHSRGDSTFKCDMLWGEKEARIIILNQTIGEFKGDNPYTRIIINHDSKEVLFQIGIEEHENGLGIVKTELFIKMLSKSWDGWNVKRFTSGYDDVIKYLKIYSPELESIHNSIMNYIPDYFKNSWDEPKGTLVSIESNEELKFAIIDKNIADLIVKGESLFKVSYSNHVSDNRLPFGGIHINTNLKELKFWYSLDSTNMNVWASKYWNEWEIINSDFDSKEHYKIIGCKSEYENSFKNLTELAITDLKDEVIKTNKEPNIAKDGYRLREREAGLDELSEKFDELIKEIMKDNV